MHGLTQLATSLGYPNWAPKRLPHLATPVGNPNGLPQLAAPMGYLIVCHLC